MLKILIVETDREAEQLALYKMRLLVSALELELISQRVRNLAPLHATYRALLLLKI